MRTRALSWRRYRVPFVREIETAHGRLAEREGLLLTLESDSGAVGLGEASPLPGFGGTVAQAEAMLPSLAQTLVGLEMEEVLAALDSLVDAGPGSAAVRCGVESAVLDLQARRAGVTIASLLARPISSAVPVNATVGIPTLTDAAAAAARAAQAGYRTVKLKVGVAVRLRDEVERIAAVRAAIGPSVALRLDANGGWTVDRALAVLRETSACDIELVEQPVAAGDLEGLRRVRAAALAPIAADESVSSLNTAWRVLEREAVDVLVIKPMAVGGARAGRVIGEQAAARGVETIVTTMLDSGVGTALALQLAAAMPGRRFADGLATATLLADDLAVGLPPVVAGVMALPSVPGLGVTVDHAALGRYALASGVRLT